MQERIINLEEDMIKYILSSLLLVSTAFASDIDLYGKIGTGISTISPLKIQTNDINGKIKLTDSFPLIEVGAGVQISDSIRTELVFDYYFLFHSKENSINLFNDRFEIDYKTKISSLMLNGYKNIITIDRFTPFIGGGVGISFLHDKATGVGENFKYDILKILEPVSSQQVTRFAYKLTAGLDIKVSDNTILDISYNYLNLGRNRPRLLDGVNNRESRDYLVHNVIVSVKFNF